jgi:glycosyltransferase involved in cell wall biosynthesis
MNISAPKPKIIRTATIALSLDYLLKGQLAFLNQNAAVIAVSGQDHHLDAVREREGVRTVDISMQRSISPLKDLISLIRLYKLFRRERPDIVHSITPKAGLLSMLAAKMAGVPVRIHTFTGLIFPSKKGVFQKLLIQMDRILCHAATHIIPEGQGVLQDLKAYNITRKPIAVLANGNVNGLDTGFFDPVKITEQERNDLRNALGIQPGDFVFIFVGRLVRDKGINELVAAFDEVSNAGENIKLLLVGPYEEELDPLLPETKQKIEQNSHIITVGFQKDVRPYMAISHVLAFPSYREGFPNVVLQAGAMELPAIVTNINGCNEIIEEGINGLLIPVGSAAALASGMLQLFKNKEQYNKIRQKTRNLVVSRYRNEEVWHAIQAFYQKLLS